MVPLSVWRRIASAAIDVCICLLPTVLLFQLWVKEGVPLSWLFGLFILVHIVYCTLFISLLDGKTVGLVAVRGRVTSGDAATPSILQALSRAISHWLGFLLLGLGWLSGLPRADKRALHEQKTA